MEGWMATATGNQISARNQIRGTVGQLKAGQAMTLVHINAEGQRLVSAITNESVQELGLKSGDPVIALVKSTDAMLIKGDAAQVKISARNRLAGQVTSVQKGNAMAYVTLKVGELQLGASITSEALDELQINNGDRATAVIKATEVMLQKA
jgi:molybdate transport system regulatory protein